MTREKLLTVTQAARQLGLGRNTLLSKLRAHGLMHTDGNLNCAPTKTAVTQGLLHPHITEYQRGPVRVQHTTTKVTAKGLVWIKDLLDQEAEETASVS